MFCSMTAGRTVADFVYLEGFYHLFDLNTIGIELEDRLEYQFVVWDNDGVNGAKKTSSQAMSYEAPSKKEIREQTQKANDQIKESLDQSKQDSNIQSLYQYHIPIHDASQVGLYVVKVGIYDPQL